MLSRQKTIIRIKGRVQQVQPEELFEQGRVKQVVRRNGIIRVLPLYFFKTRNCPVVIHNVEAVKRLSHLRISIQRICIYRIGVNGNRPA